MQPTQTTPAEAVTLAGTLRAAAQYLLEYGWYQGDLFDPDVVSAAEDLSQARPPACALGAIRMAVVGTPEPADWQPDRIERHDAAVAALADHLIDCYGVEPPDVAEVLDDPSTSGMTQVVEAWNDASDRIGSHVIAALYGAAEDCNRLDLRLAVRGGVA